jgi:prepilin-type N-terminal cleavage/methylation domain-containing protein/prepilin-type processing-associated H-X9-DG protein
MPLILLSLHLNGAKLNNGEINKSFIGGLKPTLRLKLMFAEKKRAFSLVELMIVISLLALLMAILLPALALTRSQACRAVCESNLRQLFLANAGYAIENDGHYVPAAPDITSESGGKYRWHGVRSNPNEAFDPFKGPLAAYLDDGKVKECPQRVDFVQGQQWNNNFEQGCGGYGYNMTYIGSRLWQSRIKSLEELICVYTRSTHVTEIATPVETLMFADTAMSNDGQFLIEYSFAEPPFTVYNGQVVTSFYMSPSIHFRHRGRANIGWADGHIDSHQMAKFNSKNIYGINSTNMKLGWFEPIDNTPFDLK